MRLHVLVTLALSTVAWSVPGTAGAQAEVALGRRCGFASFTDPTVGGEVQTGQLNGGPIVATAPGATIGLRCTIQVGAANATHDGVDSVAASSGPMLQAAVVGPTLVSYVSPEDQPVYTCTEAVIDGVSYYHDAVAGTWSTSSSVPCAGAIRPDLFPDVLDPLFGGGVFDCTATMPSFPGSGAATCTGTMTGTVSGSFVMDVSYEATCTGGSFAGVITVNGEFFGRIHANLVAFAMVGTVSRGSSTAGFSGSMAVADPAGLKCDGSPFTFSIAGAIGVAGS